MSFIHQACMNLRPDAGVSIDADGIHWHGILDAPSDAEIQAEAARLQAAHNAKAYQRNRAAEYPSIPDQLDLLYHGGMDAWKAAIQAVKDKYPKGAA